MKIFIINDINDILKKKITHFSLDKGLYLGYGLSENNCSVYFLTTGESKIFNNINFINLAEANLFFLRTMDLIIIVRESLITNLFDNYEDIKNYILDKSKTTKIMVKSDSIQWILDKNFRKYISENFNIKPHTKHIVKWVCNYFDYICVQTKEFVNDAVNNNIPINKIIQLNMAVPNIPVIISDLQNPYDINHNYCVNLSSQLASNKALMPLYYIKNAHEIKNFNIIKNIIVYTGRIKTDSGKIFYFMRELMAKLGDNFELHIFPGSFIIPDICNGTNMACSALNAHHLNLLRETIFSDSKNIIIHYPYEHKDMFTYLHFAYCGIDFSDIRPNNAICKAGHAKILEYCLVGLPIVCEDNINNLFLIKNGKNGIILPYLSSTDDYASAIKKIGSMQINREYCRKITFENENCIKRAHELLQLLK